MGQTGLGLCGSSLLKVPVPVTVGTAIASCPRTDPCERNYRTRLLLWMDGVKTNVGIGMQDTGKR